MIIRGPHHREPETSKGEGKGVNNDQKWNLFSFQEIITGHGNHWILAHGHGIFVYYVTSFAINFFLIPFHWQSHPRKKHSVQLCLSLISNSPKRLLVIEISLWHQELFLPAMRVTRSRHLPIISASAHHVPRCLRPCVECPLPDVARYSFHSNCAPTMCHALWWKNHVGHKILVHQEHLIF